MTVLLRVIRKIGLSIYQLITDQGGRFLDHDGHVMDQPKAVLKVMKGAFCIGQLVNRHQKPF